MVAKAKNNTKLEGMLPMLCVELGSAVAMTGKPLSGRTMMDFAMAHTLSQAWSRVRVVYLARHKKIDFIQANG